MTMSDLKNGMSVTTRQGRHYKVARNSIIDGVPYDLLISGRCPMIMFFDDYKSDMTLRRDVDLLNPDIDDMTSFDIISVEQDDEVVWSRDQSPA